MRQLLFITLSLVLTFSLGCSSSSGPTGPGQQYVFTEDEIALFDEVVFQSSYGNSDDIAERWDWDIRIKVSGSPTESDLRNLEAVAADLNGLLSGSGVQIRIVSEGQNVDLIFSPTPPPGVRASPTTGGFTTRTVNPSWQITYVEVWINTKAPQDQRHSLTRHELTHVLGFGHSSRPESVFNSRQAWTGVFTDTDRNVLRMLYSPGIYSGIPREEALRVLGGDEAAAAVFTPSGAVGQPDDYRVLHVQ